MASTGWVGGISNGITPAIDGALSINVWRRNNTVYFNDAKIGFRVAMRGYGWDNYKWDGLIKFDGQNVWGWGQVKANGQRANNYQEFWAGGASGQINVTPDRTSVYVEGYFSRANAGPWNRAFGFTVGFPSAGHPWGAKAVVDEIGEKTARVTMTLGSWGDNCDAGMGQRIEYQIAGSGKWTNLPLTTAGSEIRHLTNLKPETTYEVRTWASNGAGLAVNSPSVFFKTKPDARAIMIFPDGKKYKCKVKAIFPNGRKVYLNKWKKM